MTIELKLPLFQKIGAVADALGLECYVIGGYVRDLLLKRPSKDIDVVVAGSGIQMAEEFAKSLGRGAHIAVFKSYGTAQVKYRGVEVEFVGARKESYHRESRNPIVKDGTLEDDQLRRDFTINAMAICLNIAHFCELIDPFEGLRHLEMKMIKTPCNPDVTFSDDPLRMMRAIRFATQLGFFLEESTFTAITKNKERIKIITKERIVVEFNKIMESPKPSIGFLLMEKSGLLRLVFPELDKLKGVEKRNGKGHKDNFLHTLKVLDNVALKSDDLWLRWSALLHDIGKPATKVWDEQAGWTFKNHNYVSYKMAPTIFRNLKLPLGEPLKFVQKLVLLHMRPIVLSEDEISDSAVRRLLFDAGDDIDKLMLLCEADITSGNQEKVNLYLNNFKIVREKLVEVEQKDRIRNFQPPVKGEEIMQLFNLAPSNIVGELKMQIKDAILDGIIPNEYDAALQFLFKIADKKGLKIKN